MHNGLIFINHIDQIPDDSENVFERFVEAAKLSGVKYVTIPIDFADNFFQQHIGVRKQRPSTLELHTVVIETVAL